MLWHKIGLSKFCRIEIINILSGHNAVKQSRREPFTNRSMMPA